MLILDWYKQWLEIRAEFKAKKFELTREVKQEDTVCHSCETLRQQLEISNYEKKLLLNRILEKPEPVEERTKAPELIAPRPRVTSWAAKRQMLEREDRELARSLRNAAKPDNEKTDVAELERELGVAEKERESQVTG
jgi:hypothetical protein